MPKHNHLEPIRAASMYKRMLKEEAPSVQDLLYTLVSRAKQIHDGADSYHWWRAFFKEMAPPTKEEVIANLEEIVINADRAERELVKEAIRLLKEVR